MTDRPRGKSVAFAAVVTYEPEAQRLRAVLAAVALQVSCVLVVDNSESVQGQACVRDALARLSADYPDSRSELIPLAGNRGLSAAYNVAITRADALQAEYLLLLDQDSIVGSSMVSTLLAAFTRPVPSGFQGQPTTVGPWYVDELTHRRSVLLKSARFGIRRVAAPDVAPDAEPLGDELAGLPLMPTEMLISSGSLTPLSAFSDLGLLDEGLFIDHIDTDWSLRVHHAGRWQAVVPQADMKHQLGDWVMRLWWGHFRLLPVHSPLRLFYTFRNSLWLYRQGHAHWRWIAFDLKRLCAVVVIHMVARGPRWQRLKMIGRGLRAGFAGRQSG